MSATSPAVLTATPIIHAAVPAAAGRRGIAAVLGNALEFYDFYEAANPR